MSTAACKVVRINRSATAQCVQSDTRAMPYRMEIIEDKEEGGFVAFYPDLPGCITCGETVEIAVANALDAKKAWIEAMMEEEH